MSLSQSQKVKPARSREVTLGQESSGLFPLSAIFISQKSVLLPVTNVLCVFPLFFPATQPHRDFIVTQGGFLSCDIIIHVLGENDVRKSVSSVLEECEQRKYTSVALPAIGTGLQPLITQRFRITQIPLDSFTFNELNAESRKR